MKQRWILLAVGMLASHGLGCEGNARSEVAPSAAGQPPRAESGAKVVDGAAAPVGASSTASPDAAKAEGEVDIVGRYQLSGQDSLGRPITGTVVIKPNKDRPGSYIISRAENGKKHKGVMYRDGEHLFASWSKKGAGLRTFKPKGDGVLEGTYFGNTEPRLSTETLRGGSPDLTGRYVIDDSRFADGTRYSSTVSVSRDGDIYKLGYKMTYDRRRETFTAYGLRAGDLLGVATHAGGPFGFAHYRISEGGALQGENARSNESDYGTGKETLTRK